jgi:thymidine kinase
MSKLYFRYGTVSSAKTLNLLAVAHNYRRQGKRALILAPAIDTRHGAGRVESRAGLGADADAVISEPGDVYALDVEGVSCILVDEVQFMDPSVIDVLRDIATNTGIPVICYGLRTDFRSNLFPGAARLMAVADSIEEIKTTCRWCNRKAIGNARLVPGDDVVQLGGHDDYAAACWQHFRAVSRIGR